VVVKLITCLPVACSMSLPTSARISSCVLDDSLGYQTTLMGLVFLEGSGVSYNGVFLFSVFVFTGLLAAGGLPGVSELQPATHVIMTDTSRIVAITFETVCFCMFFTLSFFILQLSFQCCYVNNKIQM